MKIDIVLWVKSGTQPTFAINLELTKSPTLDADASCR
jgi:hypothetical protein